MAHTPQSELNTSNAAAMPAGLQYSARVDWLQKRDMLAEAATADGAADEESAPTGVTVVSERGLIFVVIDDGKREKTNTAQNADDVAAIIRKHGVADENIFFEYCGEGFERRVRQLVRTVATTADQTALLAVENQSGCDYFDRLDRLADAASRPYILINSPQEAAFAATCLKRRKTAAHFVA